MTTVSLQLPGADPQRLLRDWQPGAWIGAVRQAFGRTTELTSTPQGELVEAHPPHWLVAIWSPQRLQRPFLRRWPRWVSLEAGLGEADAAAALLRQAPPEAKLWVLHEDLDWALMAQIVLLCEPGLRPYQQRELQAFADAERAATLGRIRAGYGQPAIPELIPAAPVPHTLIDLPRLR